MAEESARRRLAAILAADVVGYSRSMGADEVGTLARLQKLLREVVRPAVTDRQGRVFKQMGDGLLAEFPSAVGAAQSATAIQEKLATDSNTLQIRIGLHIGDVIVERDDLFGEGVNLAARLQAEAEPGCIVASFAFRQQVEGRAGLSFRPLGLRGLTNVDEPVEVFALGDPSTAVAALSPRQSTHRGTRRLALAGLVLVALVFIAAWLSQAPLGPTPPRASGTPTIAVLPFDNLSPDPAQAFFAEGLAEDLIIDLSKLGGVQVVSRTSSFAVDRRLAAAEIASRLNASYIVTGSVRRAGERLRITANLVEAQADTPLWAERFDGSGSDVFGFQDEITGQIIEALRVELTPAERRAVKSRGTDNPAAYDAYLRGLRLLSARRRLDPEANEGAQMAFEEAIPLDPDYAQAYAGLAWTKWLYVESVNVFNWDSDSNAAFALAEKSIALGDNALAHRVLARRHFALLTYWATPTGRIDLAVEELTEARRLQHNNPDVRADLAIMLNFAGRPGEALELVRQAMERNPNHPDWYFAPSGIALILTDQHDRAVEDLTRWAESLTSWNVPHLFLAAALGLSGRKAEANVELARFESLSNTLGPPQMELLRRAEAEDVDTLTEPLEIRTTFYAVRRKWPMQPREEEIFFKGFRIAGMRGTPG